MVNHKGSNSSSSDSRMSSSDDTDSSDNDTDTELDCTVILTNVKQLNCENDEDDTPESSAPAEQDEGDGGGASFLSMRYIGEDGFNAVASTSTEPKQAKARPRRFCSKSKRRQDLESSKTKCVAKENSEEICCDKLFSNKAEQVLSEENSDKVPEAVCTKELNELVEDTINFIEAEVKHSSEQCKVVASSSKAEQEDCDNRNGSVEDLVKEIIDSIDIKVNVDSPVNVFNNQTQDKTETNCEHVEDDKLVTENASLKEVVDTVDDLHKNLSLGSILFSDFDNNEGSCESVKPIASNETEPLASDTNNESSNTNEDVLSASVSKSPRKSVYDAYLDDFSNKYKSDYVYSSSPGLSDVSAESLSSSDVEKESSRSRKEWSTSATKTDCFSNVKGQKKRENQAAESDEDNASRETAGKRETDSAPNACGDHTGVSPSVIGEQPQVNNRYGAGAKYTSLVMITNDASYQQVNIVTSDTTKVVPGEQQVVVVSHTNRQDEASMDKNKDNGE